MRRTANVEGTKHVVITTWQAEKDTNSIKKLKFVLILFPVILWFERVVLMQQHKRCGALAMQRDDEAVMFYSFACIKK